MFSQYGELAAVRAEPGLWRTLFILPGHDFSVEPDDEDAIFIVPQNEEDVLIPNGTLVRFQAELEGNSIFRIVDNIPNPRSDIAEFLRLHGGKYFAASPRTVTTNIKSFK